ncbi:hypothetical protein [Anaeromyxobacter oryzisoli]|uniref:hypothetical protein n=1 Tax=Anaeromyxobacter oryzisoli TaxID=2925408 RepID=UPI001F586A04|nr:hypothetical protein [Anaeromyxobacter sp. SG63]
MPRSPAPHAAPARRAAVALALALAACSSGSSAPVTPPPPPPVPAVPGVPALIQGVMIQGVTAFGQTLPSGDGYESFPGQANTWDLDRDYSLRSGGLAGPFSGALVLYAGVPTVTPPTFESLEMDVLATQALPAFPYDQTYAEATFLTPLFGAADGVRTAELSDGATAGVAPLEGSRSLLLNGTSSSRVTQTLDVSAVTAPLTLSWSHVFFAIPGALVGAPAPTFTVSFHGTDGQLLETVYTATANEDRGPGTGGSPGASFTVGPWPGHDQVVVSFELAGPSPSLVQIDGVSLAGGPATILNGDFEAGTLAGGDASWTAASPSESQNVEGAPRTLCVGSAGDCGAQLAVRRTFFAPPKAHWARITDVFENAGAAAVSADVVYLSFLAAGASTALYQPRDGALVGYDLSGGGTRDFGIVFGSGSAFFRTASAAAVSAGAPDGNGTMFVVHPLTVPPGGRVALVHFVLLAGSSTGLAGGASSPGVEADAAAILSGFRSTLDPTYRNGMRAGDADLVTNL